METNSLSLPKISVVIPVFNEENNLAILFQRLQSTLDNMKREYEIIFIDDGSKDKSLEILVSFTQSSPHIKVLELAYNSGQHAAILAGFEYATGDIIVTLDADLQNPPEEIIKLVETIEKGYDVVGGRREARKDLFWRRILSWLAHSFISKMVRVKMKDYGCMLRAYKRPIVDMINKCPESSIYIPALANVFAKNVTEVPVAHAERFSGRSKYNLFGLVKLLLNVMTGFSLFPFKASLVLGILISTASFILLIYCISVYTELRSITLPFLFFLTGVQFILIALLGEYVGRTLLEVKRRPRYMIRSIYKKDI